MAVFRKVKKTDYTIIDNNIFKNQKLSLKGKGMICTMLSLPDSWNFSEDGLTTLSNDGKASIRSTLQELMELGYLVRTRNRDEKGILRDYVYTIYEEPILDNQKQVEPNCDFPTLEKPTLENRNTYKELNNKELKELINDDNIIDFLQNNGFFLTPIQYDVVKGWEDTELTRYAIKRAVLNGKYNIAYIQAILNSYEKNNIKTVQQAMEQDQRFNKKSNKKVNVPDWFDKEYKEEEMDDETRKLIEKITGA